MPTKYDLLDELTKEELLEVADYYEIYAPSSWRKYEIIDLISSTFYKDQIEDIVDSWLDAKFSEDEESELEKSRFKYKVNYDGDNRSNQTNPNNIGLIITPKKKQGNIQPDSLPKLNKDLLSRIRIYLNLDNPLMNIAYLLVVIWWALLIWYHPYFFNEYKAIELSNTLLLLYIALLSIPFVIMSLLRTSDSRSMIYHVSKLRLAFSGALLLVIMFVLSGFTGLTQSGFIFGQFFLIPLTINLILVPAYEVFKVSESQRKDTDDAGKR